MRFFAGLLLFAALTLVIEPAAAQDPPPRIGPFVVDVMGTVPQFNTTDQTAKSRGLGSADLPSTGLGVDIGVHVYPLRWKAVTFGLGGQVTLARAHSAESSAGGVIFAHAVTERFGSVAPQLSFNFGSGHGWSYISGGMGQSIWQIVADGTSSAAADDERIRTINYGGGARWFIKRHLAFHFDVRFWQLDPGLPHGILPGTPRTTMLVMGAGASFK
jgi:hypothetical protein